MLGFLPETVGAYLRQHRQVDIRIEEVLSVEVIRRVAEGRADVGIFAASVDAVCRFAQCGFGIGIVPRSSAERFGDASSLAVVPLADDWAERRLQIAVRTLEALPSYARQLVEHLRRAAG